MRYLLLMNDDPTGEELTAADPTIEQWLEEAEPHRTHGDRLRPAEDAVTVRVRDGEVLVTAGPFTETTELLSGYDTIEVADLDDAIALAARHPVGRLGAVDIRPFHDDEGAWVFDDARVHPEAAEGKTRYVMFVGEGPGIPHGWLAEVERSGVRLDGGRLRTDEDATTVRVRGDKVLVTDGPHAESREQVGGFDLIEVGSLDEAVEVASRHVASASSGIELRPVWRL